MEVRKQVCLYYIYIYIYIYVYIYIYIYNMSVYMKCPAFTAKKFGHIIYIYIYIYIIRRKKDRHQIGRQTDKQMNTMCAGDRYIYRYMNM